MEIELAAGPIEYRDTAGAAREREKPVLVLLHGLLMDERLWAAVEPEVSGHFRVITPTLPLGAHRRAVRAGAPLGLEAQAEIVRELLERLDLHDVTLAGNDTGGAIAQLVAAQDDARGGGRIGRLALISCEAFDNLPPGLTGRTIALLGKLPPGLFGAFMQQLRLKAVRRLPIAFGWLTRRGDAVTKGWRPTRNGEAVRVLREAFADRQVLVRAAAALRRFDRPALVIWAAEDRVMPPAHGRRLAELLPQAKLVEIPDSYTLIPLDQPRRLAEVLTQSW
jgi:pimeloyl-ACP methyl ester carboxylesterase